MKHSIGARVRVIELSAEDIGCVLKLLPVSGADDYETIHDIFLVSSSDGTSVPNKETYRYDIKKAEDNEVYVLIGIVEEEADPNRPSNMKTVKWVFLTSDSQYVSYLVSMPKSQTIGNYFFGLASTSRRRWLVLASGSREEKKKRKKK